MTIRKTTLCALLVAVLQLAAAQQSRAQSILVNGSFESGNSGFTSQYMFAPGGNSTEGQYTVRPDPQNWNGFFAPTPDHTSGSGNMLVVNGATSGNPFLWRQSVAVDPSTTYEFSYWLSTAVSGGPAVLVVEINGTPIGGPFTAPASTGVWDNWTETWNSDQSTLAEITIFNSNLSTFPNDFYLDDLSFSAVPVPEPGVFPLLVIGASWMIHRWRRR
jgi:hypothetical protein